MADINVIVLTGRLTAEPELRTTSSGIPVCRFTIASDKITKQGEEKKANFVQVTAWRGTAEFICKYYKRGQLVCVEGSLQTDNYTDSEGKNRMSIYVLCDHIKAMSRSNTEVVAENANTTSQEVSNASASDFEEIPDEEDLPF